MPIWPGSPDNFFEIQRQRQVDALAESEPRFLPLVDAGLGPHRVAEVLPSGLRCVTAYEADFGWLAEVRVGAELLSAKRLPGIDECHDDVAARSVLHQLAVVLERARRESGGKHLPPLIRSIWPNENEMNAIDHTSEEVWSATQAWYELAHWERGYLDRHEAAEVFWIRAGYGMV